MKKLIITLLMLFTVLAFPKSVLADGQTCVTQYGGGVTCTTSTPTEVFHPEKTAIGDVNFPAVGVLLLAGSGILLYFSKKLNKA